MSWKIIILYLYLISLDYFSGSYTSSSKISGEWKTRDLNHLPKFYKETYDFIQKNKPAYPNWYNATDKINQKTELRVFQPTDFESILPAFDASGFCILLRTVEERKSVPRKNGEGGILFVGDETVARFVIQLAALLNAEHNSTECVQETYCEFGICPTSPFGGYSSSIQSYLKLSFVRNDLLSFDQQFQEFDKNKYCDIADKSSFCQVWATDDILSKYTSLFLSIPSDKLVNTDYDKYISDMMDKLRDKMSSDFDDQLIILFNSINIEILCSQDYSKQSCGIEYLIEQNLKLQNFVAEEKKKSKRPDKNIFYFDIYDATFTWNLVNTEKLSFNNTNKSTELINGLSTDFCDLIQLPSDLLIYWSDFFYGILLEASRTSLLDLYPDHSFSLVKAELRNCKSFEEAEKLQAVMEFSILNFLSSGSQLKKIVGKDPYSGNSGNTTVVLSVTDMPYAEEFPSWYYTRAQYPGLINVLIAFNKETCIHLRTKLYMYDHLCVIYPDSMYRVFKSISANMAVGFIKVIFPLTVLANVRKNVIFSEMDVFWRVNPVPELTSEENSKFDIQVTAHVDFWPSLITLKRELNIGFYYLKVTNSTLLLFSDMLSYATINSIYMGSFRTWDQKLFDHFIRGNNPVNEDAPQMKMMFKNWEKFRTDGELEKLKWRRLPGSKYIHNQGKKLPLLKETIVYHLSWGLVKPSLRIYCAFTLGLVSYNYTVPVEYLNTNCFD